MKNIQIGNFEELMLLLIGVLYDNAYSVNIVAEYQKHTGKTINVSAIHTVLYRLEEKGYLESKLSEATSERGGKRKRLFYLTPLASKALRELATLREELLTQIPAHVLQWKEMP